VTPSRFSREYFFSSTARLCKEGGWSPFRDFRPSGSSTRRRDAGSLTAARTELSGFTTAGAGGTSRSGPAGCRGGARRTAFYSSCSDTCSSPSNRRFRARSTR
jgi:hypothetical protein